jgi:hypothetical protein
MTFIPTAVIRGEYARGETQMTRKQALHKALEALETLSAPTPATAAPDPATANPDPIDTQAAAEILRGMIADLPLTGWTEKTIFDTIDQFIIDHGRIPTVTDFKKKGLPPHPVIKLRFNMTLREFLDKHYPDQKLCSSKIYFPETKEHWRDLFLTDYYANKPCSAEEHNANRTSGTPSWQTIAKMFEIIKWLDWLSFCEITPYVKKREPVRGSVPPTQFYITSTMRVTCADGRTFNIAKDTEGVPYII